MNSATIVSLIRKFTLGFPQALWLSFSNGQVSLALTFFLVKYPSTVPKFFFDLRLYQGRTISFTRIVYSIRVRACCAAPRVRKRFAKAYMRVWRMRVLKLGEFGTLDNWIFFVCAVTRSFYATRRKGFDFEYCFENKRETSRLRFRFITC